MQQCFLCSATFDGKTVAKLVNHVRDAHSISFEEYVVQSEYDGIAPRCACGLCNERPLFRRGKFSEYALEHEKFETQEKLYIDKYGIPKCLCCGGDIDFYRGRPRQFCSHICAGKHNGGFTQQNTQDKIKRVVIEKYGVDNVAKLREVRDKISLSNKGSGGWHHTDKSLKLISEHSKKNWQDSNFRMKVIPMFSALRRRNWQNPVYRQTILQGNLSGKHSKLHQKIADHLGLKRLGFESEKVLFRYRVDEVHFEKKIIVEINGDYVHANPSKFKAEDIIVLRSSQYTAQDKWNYDQKRKEALESLGFTVFVVWQSDDLNEKKNELLKLLEKNYDNKI